MPFDVGHFTIPEQPMLEVLREARDRVASPGAWCRGIGDHGKTGCALSWVTTSLGGRWLLIDVADVLEASLPFHWRMFRYVLPWARGGMVIAYNDVFWRRQRAMVKLFDRAIGKLEGCHAV